MDFTTLIVSLLYFGACLGNVNNDDPIINGNTIPSVPITEINSSTTTSPNITVTPTNSTPTTTTPTTPITSTTKPSTSTTKPNPTTTIPTTNSPTSKSTGAPATTASPHQQRKFDGPSFVGGIILALGLSAIGFVAFKFYKARTEQNYHTL